MTSTVGLVARFTAVGVAVLAGLAALLALAARQAGVEQATESASEVAFVTAKGVVEPRLDKALIDGDPAARAAFDRAMRQYVLAGSLVRVKLWDESGRIIYSDQAGLDGTTWELEEEELEALREQRIDSEVSDLSRPENRFEVRYGKLLEVYAGVRAPTGQRLLFEVYFRYDAVDQAGQAAWHKFAPIALGALVALQLVQIPLAWSLARRVQRQQRERERLLRHAVDASDSERRRIAGELHDGVVQQLTGITYALDAARLGKPDESQRAEVISQAAADLRTGIGQLRSLLVDIYPPNLDEEGLASALAELAAGLERTGVGVTLDVADTERLTPVTAGLLFRTAQEALRNVSAHSGASQVDIKVVEEGGMVRLVIDDDGRGFDGDLIAERAEGGHFGLRALSDLISDARGRLVIRSAPAAGTRVEAEVPVHDPGADRRRSRRRPAGVGAAPGDDR
ncbi:sensor histidine kinase [Actinoplanes sp. NPDC049265]|uniref:sensor histidine kinase n=1 Tax=Actinoplanes sp. NPDC049265 TaxID=3363902 RepID=UPI003719B718